MTTRGALGTVHEASWVGNMQGRRRLADREASIAIAGRQSPLPASSQAADGLAAFRDDTFDLPDGATTSIAPLLEILPVRDTEFATTDRAMPLFPVRRRGDDARRSPRSGSAR